MCICLFVCFLFPFLFSVFLLFWFNLGRFDSKFFPKFFHCFEINWLFILNAYMMQFAEYVYIMYVLTVWLHTSNVFIEYKLVFTSVIRINCLLNRWDAWVSSYHFFPLMIFKTLTKRQKAIDVIGQIRCWLMPQFR